MAACERAKPAEVILVDAEWTCCVASGWATPGGMPQAA